MKYSLLLSGGGTRGIIYVGLFKKILELNIQFKRIVGVSIGSIFGLLYLLDYSFDEMYKILIETDFTKLQSRIKISNFINNYGIDSFTNIKLWIEKLITQKGLNYNITFSEFYNINKVHYQVISSNLEKYTLTIFDYIKTPNIRIIDAIRMSCSIPFLFIPMKYNGDIHIDGGLIDNFPIDLLQEDLPYVIGILINTEYKIQYKINNILNYSQAVVNTLLQNRVNDKRVRYINYKSNIIEIKIPKEYSNPINFAISRKECDFLVELGYSANFDISIDKEK